jgi:hypothetical protein
MISPEVDWWIKNTTQVKHPVYHKKRYAISQVIGGVNTITFPVNQNENIKLVLCPSFTISTNTSTIETIVDKSQNITVFSAWLFQNVNTVDNFNYLVESENITFTTVLTTTIVTMAYITISSNT